MYYYYHLRYESIWFCFVFLLLLVLAMCMQRTHFSVIRFGPPSKVKCFPLFFILLLLSVWYLLRIFHAYALCSFFRFSGQFVCRVFTRCCIRSSHFLWCFPWRLTFSFTHISFLPLSVIYQMQSNMLHVVHASTTEINISLYRRVWRRREKLSFNIFRRWNTCEITDESFNCMAVHLNSATKCSLQFHVEC